MPIPFCDVCSSSRPATGEFRCTPFHFCSRACLESYVIETFCRRVIETFCRGAGRAVVRRAVEAPTPAAESDKP